MKFTVIGLLVALTLVGCNKPAQQFADEDACEDAGMSDAYCDRLFPEWEDFNKKKKPKTYVAPVAKPSSSWKSSSSKPSKSWSSSSRSSSRSYSSKR